MKILYVTNGIVGAGGLERVLSLKSNYFSDLMNYEVHILVLNQGDLPLFYSFSKKVVIHDVKVVGSPIKYLSLYIKGIRKVYLDVNPDIVSVCDDGLKGFFLPLILGKRKPIIYERHVSKEIEMNINFPIWKKIMVKLKWKLMDVLASKFSKFIVLTNQSLNEWKSLENIKIIPNPLSFYPTENSELDKKQVIAVGKQGYQKGYDLLLQAWKIVNNKFPDWRLSVYGKKDNNENLEDIAKNLKIDTSITFFNPEKNIQKKYLDSSIYVMSSRYEGFGMVLIEAMACGVPCVSFDCPYGPSDIINNDEDGLLVKNGDISALANALIKLISDSDLRKEMGAKAKQNVKRYLPENVIQQWDKLFKELIG